MDKEIKYADGAFIKTESAEIFCPSPSDIWKAFNWDIENDDAAKECADIIMRELFAVHFVDLSPMYGAKLTIELIPPTDDDEKNYDSEKKGGE